MRTDGGRERGVSRRSFVASAGTLAGVAVAGSGAASDESGETVRAAATEPYNPRLRRTAASYERATSDGTVTVESAGGDLEARLRDGDLDVVVSGEPSLSNDAVPSDVRRSVTVTDWAALDVPVDHWQECLRRERLREVRDGDTPVEFWSESDWDSVASLAQAGGSPEAGSSGTKTKMPDPLPIVYGTRAYQYARGQGGLTHYLVGNGRVDRDIDGRSETRDGTTPLVRLGYAHVARDRPDDALTSFLGVYDRRTGNADVDVAYFPPPDATGDAVKGGDRS